MSSGPENRDTEKGKKEKEMSSFNNRATDIQKRKMKLRGEREEDGHTWLGAEAACSIALIVWTVMALKSNRGCCSSLSSFSPSSFSFLFLFFFFLLSLPLSSSFGFPFSFPPSLPFLFPFPSPFSSCFFLL